MGISTDPLTAKFEDIVRYHRNVVEDDCDRKLITLKVTKRDGDYIDYEYEISDRGKLHGGPVYNVSITEMYAQMARWPSPMDRPYDDD